MLFNSIEFLFFFLAVAVIYFCVSAKYRWLVLLVSSYYFYMNWNPAYAILIFISTLTTYFASVLIFKSGAKKSKLFLVFSLIVNLGILILFKYYNFINDTILKFLSQFGVSWDFPELNFLLPVGISFYTFQAIGYTLDVYRGDMEPEHHFGRYALFVSFFPQLVAGPIERATHLLPQFRNKIVFSYQNLDLGLKKILWGLIMKVGVADRVGIYVDAVYGNVQDHSGVTLWLASILFAIQIYCDFAGYSSIAIGTARILGFDLMENFRRPYFSTSISEFWSRWHISLSTWFRDYLYIPLGGNRVKLPRHLFNLLITFIVSGLWHGANYTFIIWGICHGVFLITEVLLKKNAVLTNKFKFNFWLLNWIVTQFCVVLAWVLFRSNNIQEAFIVLSKMITLEGANLFLDKTTLSYAFLSIGLLIIREIYLEFNLSIRFPKSILFRGIAYAILLYWIVLFGVVDSGQFIYFQF